MIGRYFIQMSQLQPARFDGLGGLFRRQSQFSFWSARFAQYDRFLARALMPVDDREETARLKDCAHRKHQSRSIRNAVKSIRHEYEVSISRNQLGKVVSIAGQIVTIRDATLGQTVMRERAREARPDVTLTLDTLRRSAVEADWNATFERRIRDVASRAVAHLKRGDRVAVVTTAGGGTRADRSVGADPLLRYLALVEPVAQGAAPVAEAGE